LDLETVSRATARAAVLQGIAIESIQFTDASEIMAAQHKSYDRTGFPNGDRFLGGVFSGVNLSGGLLALFCWLRRRGDADVLSSFKTRTQPPSRAVLNCRAPLVQSLKRYSELESKKQQPCAL
jgi:hypothetical protein